MKAFQVDVRRGNSASKHMESCSKSLVIREMYIKTTMRDHLKSTRKALVKKKKRIITSFGKDVEKLRPSLLVRT